MVRYKQLIKGGQNPPIEKGAVKMRKNVDVVKSFMNGLENESHTYNLWSNGEKLFSYNTCIAQWIDDKLIISTRGYSSTTRGKHQSHLKRMADLESALYVEDILENTSDLSDFEKLTFKQLDKKDYWAR